MCMLSWHIVVLETPYVVGIPIVSNLSTLAAVRMSVKSFCQHDNISTVQVAVTKLYRCVGVR